MSRPLFDTGHQWCMIHETRNWSSEGKKKTVVILNSTNSIMVYASEERTEVIIKIVLSEVRKMSTAVKQYIADFKVQSE